METKIAALILAGGKSSRMGGQDRVLIPRKGTPMLLRVAYTANMCCQRVYILTHRATQYRSIFQDNCIFLEEKNWVMVL